MLMRLILLMTIVPALELVLLVNVHQWLAERYGSGNALLLTIGSILATGIIGANLARSQGFSVIRKFQAASAKGQMPTDEIMDGFMILVGGALLLTPGFLTDLFGFSLLIPFTRAAYRQIVRRMVIKGIQSGAVNIHFQAGGGFTPPSGFPSSTRGPQSGDTLEAEYIEPRNHP